MQPRWEQIPPFGWNPTTLLSLSGVSRISTVNIVDGSLISASFMRPAGVDSISVYLNILVSDWAGGAGSVSVIVEGSNDNVQTITAATKDINDHWTEIAILDADEWFLDTGAGLISNNIPGGADEAAIRLMEAHILPFNLLTQPVPGRFEGESDIDIGRFRYLRVRAARETGANTFLMTVMVRATAQDSQRHDKTEALSGVRTAGATTWGTTWKRAAGTRYMACQVVASRIFVDGGLGAYIAVLHASMDGNAPWFSLGAYNFTTDGIPPATNYSDFLTQAGRIIVDMEPFQYFRTAVYDWTLGGGNQYFNITFYTACDTNDITEGKIAISDLNDQTCLTFYRVNFEAFIDAGAGGGGTIQGQIFDLGGRPIRDNRAVCLVISDDAFGGVRLPSVLAQIAAVTTGTLIYPAAIVAGLTEIVVVTDANGMFNIQLTPTGAVPATTYINAESYTSPQIDFDPTGVGPVLPAANPGSVLYSTERAVCAMT
jgi:hypothetical protein